jgi:hypothetical protein
MKKIIPPAVSILTFVVLAMCCLGIAVVEPASAQTATRESFLLGPPKNGGPVVVRAGFYLIDINAIDEESETFEFQGTLTLKWRDKRQAFDPTEAGVDEKVYQGAYQFNEVFTGWFPQVILANESGLYEKRGILLRVQPDGSMTYMETVNAAAETTLNLRRIPFDRQRLEAIFGVLGFNKNEVVLQADPDTTGPWPGDSRTVRISQWSSPVVSTSVREGYMIDAGGQSLVSMFVVLLAVKRDPFFMVRLVIVPLALLVVLSWSVFWMDRSSLGERMDISFIGILTAVAYHLVITEILPRISYMTFVNAFIYVSFYTMCASVVINLTVGWLDRHGKTEIGDRVDYRCRWMFPLAYFASLLFAVGLVSSLSR